MLRYFSLIMLMFLLTKVANSKFRPSIYNSKKHFNVKLKSVIPGIVYGRIPKVRVRVLKSRKMVRISGLDIRRKLMTVNNVKSYQGRKRVEFNCGDYSKGNKIEKTVLLASLKSMTGLISLENKKFRGDLNILVSPKSMSCDVVNEIPLESYISSLLAKEMNGSWPVEALKAQSVAARTYALQKMTAKQVSKELGHEAYYDLESSEKHQVGGDFFDATLNTERASDETRGEILLNKSGTLVPAFFHAKCGGRTFRPDQVWGNKVLGYKARECPYCKGHGPKNWKFSLSKKRFLKFLDRSINKSGLELVFKESSKSGNLILVPDRYNNNKLRVYLGEKVYVLDKLLVRRYFGRKMIPSNHFVVKINKSKVFLRGKGLGHGVGMCQLGALSLAKMGWSYKKILKHYFPGFILKKAY